MIAMPSKAQLATYARLQRLDFSPHDLEAIELLSGWIKEPYDRIEALADERIPLPINRAAGSRYADYANDGNQIVRRRSWLPEKGRSRAEHGGQYNPV